MEMDPMKVHAFPSQLFQQWCKDLIIFCRWWLNLCMSNGPIFYSLNQTLLYSRVPVLDFNTVVIMHIFLRQYENSVYIKTNNTLCSLSFSSLNIKESFWKRYSCISCSISSVCHMLCNSSTFAWSAATSQKFKHLHSYLISQQSVFKLTHQKPIKQRAPSVLNLHWSFNICYSF